MAKTALDVTTRAFRRLNIVAAGEVPEAEDHSFALAALNGAIDEMRASHGVFFAFDAASVPDEVFLPLADLVAAEIASAYGTDGPNRSRALGRVRAILMPDDRRLRGDGDKDGALTDAEEYSAGRAAFY